MTLTIPDPSEHEPPVFAQMRRQRELFALGRIHPALRTTEQGQRIAALVLACHAWTRKQSSKQHETGHRD